jgi:WD40 repeat protein
LVLTRADQFVRVWDAETGEPVSPPLPHNTSVIWADWSPDGREIVTCVSGGKIRIWDVSPAGSSVAELTRQAELMAAHRLDPQIGRVPLTTAEIIARWREQKE